MTLLGSAVHRALDRVRSGAALDADDAEALLSASGPDEETLTALAGRLRDDGLAAAGRPGVITYSRKVFVPLTTLCRDRCHYCIFVDTPGQLALLRKPAYMSPEQVLQVVRQGQALGCKEAREWLDAHGFASTIDYVAHIAALITAETGMLVHANPGVMTDAELRRLRTVSPSMGMMLETTSRRLFEERGQVHYGSPDKDPDLRLAVIEDAGRRRVPFTTGILVGIGETIRDRAESLVAIRDAHVRRAASGRGHVQEVIVQNFRAKPRTAMRDAPDADLDEYVRTVAVARLVMGPHMRIQVPPNLSDPREFARLVAAGIDDWGGVSPLTADHVNPERPWPHVDDLASATANLGYTLRERLTAHPEYVRDADTWLDPGLAPAVAALADPDTGLAAAGSRVSTVENAGRIDPGAPAAPTEATSVPRPSPRSGATRLAERAADDPASLDDAEWVDLLESTGEALDVLARTADDVRRYTVGEAVSMVVNRNLTSTGFRATPTGEPGTFSLDEVAEIAADAAALGATEICVQGRLPDAEDPAAYLAIARTITAAAPALHLHAYRPQDVRDLADRGGLGLPGALAALRDAGVDTVPGTGVKVLSERVRALVAPDDLDIARWEEGIITAHEAGFRSTSVLFYGHVETAAERIAHLRRLRGIQERTRGFTEFVPIPLPGPAGGVPLVPGRAAIDEHRAMVAVSRLLLSGSIAHVQIPWTRVGRDAAATLLRSGGDDLGGTLLDGRVRPDTGIEQGLEFPRADAERLAARLLRPFRQRTTDYREAAR